MLGAPVFRTALFGPWSGNALWTAARAVPSLDLRFADNKSLVDAVTGASLITFTRASSGTYVDSAGVLQTAATDVPRFDHNPATGESLGLLVEEQRTNLLQRSEAIATSPWFGGANTTLSNNTGEVLDPAGGSTATKVVVSGGTGAFGQGATLTAVVHSGSIWLRCATGTISANLIVYLAGSPFTNIGTTNVTITTSWQRFNVVTSSATAASYNLQLNNISAGTVYAWGAQLEAGAFPTSYIPTTTAAATRSADVASITGSAFSSWYRQDEGTMFASATAAVAASILPCYASIDNGTTSERLQLRRVINGTSPSYRVVAGGQSIDSATKTIGSPTGFNSHVLAYASSNYEGACNGTLEGLISIVNRPTATQLQIGNGAGSTVINGHIRRLTYWPQRLADPTLQQITQ